MGHATARRPCHPFRVTGLAGALEARQRLGMRVRRGFVESPSSIGGRARSRRWAALLEHFPDLAEMRVLDLGGTVDWWTRAPVRPAQVVVVNLYEPGDSADPACLPVTGDACAARDVLVAAGRDTSFDLVLSNSLIEHVGGHAQRLRLAEQVRTLAPYHWVQTPYRYFPMEPHWLFPGMQFLPVGARTAVAARWPLQHTRPATREDARSEVQWTELLSISEMRGYFPESEIYKERLAGVVKSLVAVSSPDDGR
jgi:hypothetical protein